MNKKFSTLVASVMLAASVSAGAQTNPSGEYKSGSSYLLGNGTDFITVVGDMVNGYTLKFADANAISGLESVNKALWTVEVQEGVQGATPKFVFINKSTGIPFALDLSKAVKCGDALPTGYQLKLNAGYSNDWYNGLNAHEITTAAPLMTYFKAGSDSVAFIHKADGGELVLLKATTEDMKSQAFKIQPYKANEVVLTAEDLNTNLRSNPDKNGWFSLNFDPDVVENTYDNIFTKTELQAEEIKGGTNVYLKAKGVEVGKAKAQGYIVVDTAYIKGTENNRKLISFTHAAFDDAKRLRGSYMFRFTYDPTADSMSIKVDSYYDKSDAQGTNGSWWTELNNYGSDKGDGRYVRLAELTKVRELTLGKKAEVNTRIYTDLSASKYIPTTLESGVYMIKLNTNKPWEKNLNGAYKIAKLNGTFTWELEERNERFEHMPATHWIVEKQGNTSTAAVKVTNREFQDMNSYMAGQLYKVEGSDAVFFYNYGSIDTLQFVKVDAEIAADKYLGYKHLTDEECAARVYSFNYLHGLNMDTYLNVPEGKDSIVRVDEKGGKAWFQLEKVVKEDSYGSQAAITGVAKLVRDVYRIKVRDAQKLDKDNLYLRYDSDLKKYVTTEDDGADVFFLKENNEVEGCYYALIQANLIDTYDKNKKHTGTLVKDHLIKTYELNLDNEWVEVTHDFKSSAYASRKVSVDDNTLDLTQNSVDNDGQEVRVSAFAIAHNESPLYRRFNVADLEENANDAPNVMKFFRINSTEKEYLYEDFNSKYSAGKGTGFLGVEGKGDNVNAAMYVDTAYVNRNTLMPQYLIAVGPSIVEGDTTICDVCGKLDCDHSKVTRGYTEGRYLINLIDSVKKYDNTANKDKYTWNQTYKRLAFVQARHMGDSLIIMTPKPTAADTIDLAGNKHNPAAFSFRLLTDENNNFLIESESWNNKDEEFEGGIAPTGKGGWIKIQNGVPVIVNVSYAEAARQAEIFNSEVTDEKPTDNEEIATSEVTVIAGVGQVTIANAAGKKVVVSNILGQTVANTVITSDNAVIAAPQGVVVVAVEGEEAVKAIVK